MKNRTNSCKKWLAVLLSVSMLPTAILQNGSMAYAEEKKQEEAVAVTAEEALENRETDIVVEEISISVKICPEVPGRLLQLWQGFQPTGRYRPVRQLV